MNLSNAVTFLLFLPNVVARPDENDTKKRSLRAYLRKTREATGPGNSGAARASAKGQLLARGKFGKIDISSAASAQSGAQSILEDLSKTNPGLSNKETFKAQGSHQGKNSNARHMRFGQEIHGLPVAGAALVVHTDEEGEVVGINGELVSSSDVPSSIPTIEADVAIAAALDESNVPASEHENCSPPELTIVRGLDDGKAYLAWTCTVRYDVIQDDGFARPFKDQIFAHATGEPGLIQVHPLIYGAMSLETKDCNSRTRCETYTTSSTKLSGTGDLAIESAHNFAIDTYNYYFSKFGRDSIDDAGMPLISRVHYNRKYNNAFWDGTQMTYGDGDGNVFDPLSQDADVVAHELTHGVTERTSGLIYQNESGALNEAMSDIFGMLLDQALGANTADTWMIGEDIYTPNTPGDALRYMDDPERAGDYDYYPTRYTGTSDNGGVHWNSGIANLAAYLMVRGGTHPRGKTSNTVTPIGGVADDQLAFDTVGEIFYNANVGCLTPNSNFAAARYCTADVFGGSYTANVNEAWDAVGVTVDPPTVNPVITFTVVDGTGTESSQSASTGDVQQYSMTIGAGSTVSCSTSGNNGDADLYIRFNEEAIVVPDRAENECDSTSSTSNESCTSGLAPAADTVVYAAVHAWTGYSSLTVTCTENTEPPVNCPTCGNGDQCCSGTCASSGPPSSRACLP